jgi:hypothetical protein
MKYVYYFLIGVAMGLITICALQIGYNQGYGKGYFVGQINGMFEGYNMPRVGDTVKIIGTIKDTHQ